MFTLAGQRDVYMKEKIPRAPGFVDWQSLFFFPIPVEIHPFMVINGSFPSVSGPIRQKTTFLLIT